MIFVGRKISAFFWQIRLQEKTYFGLLTYHCDRSEEVFRLAR